MVLRIHTPRLVLVVGALGATTIGVGAAEASLIDQTRIEYWAGAEAGAHRAVLVLDNGSDQVAFGYRWDGDATSWDMLQAVDAAGTLDVDITDYGDLGLFINGFSYGTFSLFGEWPASYLGSWTSDDGVNWSELIEGVAIRELSDGLFDGWSLEPDTTTFVLENPPRTPVVPEPASLALVAAGLAVALRHRGR